MDYDFIAAMLAIWGMAALLIWLEVCSARDYHDNP